MSVIINNLEFNYDNFSLSADLKINNGEFLSILGPSGSGKTTLLRLVAGFLSPDSGRIIINDRDVTEIQTSSRNIGMVFQDYALFPHLDVFHNIAYGLEAHKFSRKSIKRRVPELLSIVSLEGYEHRRIHELSGGEQQRVALARAIAPEPELLLFDEPLSALDVKLRKNLRREIIRIQSELGFTAVYVTHDQEEAMSVSDRIAVMNQGSITQTGTPEQLYNEPVDFFTADFIGIMNKFDHIMFRPEACSILQSPDTGEFLINVTVESSEYAGGYYICDGTAGNDNIVFFSSEKIRKGTETVLSVDTDKLISC